MGRSCHAARCGLEAPSRSGHTAWNLPTARRPVALCSTAGGPLKPPGATVVCGSTKAGKFVAASTMGRYVTVELSSRAPKATSTLALAEIQVFARREWSTAAAGGLLAEGGGMLLA